MESGLVHVRSGQPLLVLHERELRGAVRDVVQKFGLTRQHTHVNATFVDGRGVSFRARTYGRRDLEAFCAAGVWQHFFESGFGQVNPSYVGTRHAVRHFPDDFC